MKHLTLIMILSMLSMPSLAADQWLCTVEKRTTIVDKGKGKVEAWASDSDMQFVVSKEGLKWVGADDYHFSAEECTAASDGGIDCDSNLVRKGFMNMAVFMSLASFYFHQIVFLDLSFVPYYVGELGYCEKL